MVDNLAEKVNECLLNQLSIVCLQLGPQKLSVIRSSGVSAIQELLNYCNERKDSQDFRNCPLYCHCSIFFFLVYKHTLIVYSCISLYTIVNYSIFLFPQTPGGCIFGGYTDVSWSSRFKRGKFASSPKSFLFTLVNPSNTPPSKFEINQPAYAINNHPRLVPMFM